MLDLNNEAPSQTLAELHQLRMQAIHLFEECLTHGDDAPFVQFVEHLIASGPRQTQLLREIADDLQARLLALKEHHYDVRNQVVTAVEEGYGVDITELAPAKELEHYHKLDASRLVAYIERQARGLASEDLLILHKMIAASLEMAAQLQGDIRLTQRLHQLVTDWVGGMYASAVRLQWPDIEGDGHSRRSLQH